MAAEKKSRRRYTAEYRAEAARLVIDTGRPIAHVAQELGIGSQLLGRWVQAERDRDAGEPDGDLSLDERAELKRLRREVSELRKDNEFLGKAAGLLRVEATTIERFELMAAEKANFEVARMARLLRVSRSGYYQWAQRRVAGPSSRARRQASLDERVRALHEASDQVYGAPRITADLHQEGTAVNVKTVASSLRRQGLEGISPRSFSPVTTIPGVPTHHIPDRVSREWDTGELNRVWVSDITYLRTGEGWLYLCVVRDGCSRRVLGWAMDSHQDSDLVERALTMARTLRGDVPGQVVFHADRGTQYTSDQLHRAAKRLGVEQSMGRTGVCFDNAMAESFWSTLKHEFYHRHTWPTRAQARREVARWIEVVYNRRRRHSALGYQRPVEFETTKTQTDTGRVTKDQAA
ncbi:IS3 family transposase [Tessaracoccus palaemonis]|uniref:IS3 family transposase n=1 Tax=Tessaracoccus palaemonis TaxID=2829499 RepID=A0ABX8SKT2_9ACTN|nr:IS3 family transposase [Tessaracoccus palaemonis]QXT61750.1 IS3 family transposase [Tessaracoccus palaemonis]QXT61814.1 IS3 family transposase [Tessaracoccus palaemonis]QXT62670.1 IS3 family transposase [Tessaracoccus palaemonis]QXT62819.1 IS3 family transposase [Tessaracoccus palaemonis]QXT63892.1 IS3 family transposase [Tessaracoccus palaemonis]